MREENVMKAVLCFLMILMSASVLPGESLPKKPNWMDYENVMSGTVPVEVPMPTEIERNPTSLILDQNRVPGKDPKRAPALEEREKRFGVIER